MALFSKMYYGYELVNLTPHTINLVTENGEEIAVEPSGQLARVTTETVRYGYIGKIPLTKTEYGVVEGLPEPNDNCIYIVSLAVASRVPNRTDVMIPNESIRDDKGHVVGCKSLGHV